MKKMTQLTKLAVILVMILGTTVLPGKPASTVKVWEEGFEDPDALNDWTLFGVTGMNTVQQRNNDSGFSILDGALTAPNSTNFDTGSMAIHDSTVAYGTWHFKWHVAEGSDRGAYDNLVFIINDPNKFEDIDGTTQEESLENVSGYGLLMISFHTPAMKGAKAPGLNLCKFTKKESSPVEIIATRDFDARVTGWHDIVITRNSTGVFQVGYDSVLVIEATDTFTTTSEYFVFGSFKGDSRIDNITVSDTVDVTFTTTSTAVQAEGYLLWLVIPAMSVLVLIQKRKKL